MLWIHPQSFILHSPSSVLHPPIIYQPSILRSTFVSIILRNEPRCHACPSPLARTLFHNPPQDHTHNYSRPPQRRNAMLCCPSPLPSLLDLNSQPTSSSLSQTLRLASASVRRPRSSLRAPLKVEHCHGIGLAMRRAFHDRHFTMGPAAGMIVFPKGTRRITDMALAAASRVSDGSSCCSWI